MTPEPRLVLSRIGMAALSTAGCLLAGCAGGGVAKDDGVSKVAPPTASVVRIEGGPITVPIEGTSVEMGMVPVNGAPGGGFYAADTEVTWDLYDAFIFNLDTDAGKSTSESDAVTRPSKPYILVDRGYGHAGFAALSISPKAAEQVVEWLSAKTGRNFRIPTEAELSHLLATSGVEDAEARMEYGWFEENSDYTTHEVGSLPADANGLHDVWGNLTEWTSTPHGDRDVVHRGGAWNNGPRLMREPNFCGRHHHCDSTGFRVVVERSG